MKTIFVFGSNREGRHGKGAALDALEKYGAIYGQAEGRQGNSYAIITKELRKNKPSVTLEEIREGVIGFLVYARNNMDLTFKVTPIGCGLAGFSPEQVAPLFYRHTTNVILPDEFIKVIE